MWSNGFSNSHVWMWELDNKESWALKNWCFRTVVSKKTLESPLNCKEIKPVYPKEINPEYSLEGTDAGAEAPILWPPDAKSQLIRKDPDAGKDWRQEEKGTTEDEMVVWYHQLNGREFEQAPGVGDGPGSLGCCSQWSRKESDKTERLNNNLFGCTELQWSSRRIFRCGIWSSVVCIFTACGGDFVLFWARRLPPQGRMVTQSSCSTVRTEPGAATHLCLGDTFRLTGSPAITPLFSQFPVCCKAVPCVENLLALWISEDLYFAQINSYNI